MSCVVNAVITLVSEKLHSDYRYYGRSRLLVLLAIALVMSSMGAWLLQFSIFCKVIGLVGIAYATWASCIFVLMLCGPLIIVDAEGIVDNASAVGVGRISWGNIKHCEVIEFFGRSYVTIELNDNFPVLNRLSIWKRHILKRRLKRQLPMVIIPAHLIGLHADEFVTLIKSHMRTLN